MKKIQSPYVVRLYFVIETTNNYYLVQEYCDGGDFNTFLEKKKTL